MTFNDLMSITISKPYCKKKGSSNFIVMVFLLLSIQTISAQQRFPDYKFHTLSPEGGLNFDGVSGIKQDIYGFIWVLLSDELYRFDGYTYKRYSSKLKKQISNFSFNSYIPLVEDHAGNLFLCSKQGIVKYHRK